MAKKVLKPTKEMVKPKRLKLFDGESGEVYEDLIVFFGKPKPVDTGFVKVYIAFLEDLILNEKVTGKAVRLLLASISDIDWNNLELYIHPPTMAKNLQVDQATVYRWLSILIEEDILERTDKKYIYKLKPYSIIKGCMQELELESKKTANKSKSKKGGKSHEAKL